MHLLLYLFWLWCASNADGPSIIRLFDSAEEQKAFTPCRVPDMQGFFGFLLTQLFTEINMRACSSQEHFFTSDQIFVSHYVLFRQHKKDGLKTSYCLQDLFSLFPQHFYFAAWSKYSVWSVNCARGFDVESLPSNVSFLFNDFCFQVDVLWVISWKKKKGDVSPDLTSQLYFQRRGEGAH